MAVGFLPRSMQWQPTEGTFKSPNNSAVCITGCLLTLNSIKTASHNIWASIAHKKCFPSGSRFYGDVIIQVLKRKKKSIFSCCFLPMKLLWPRVEETRWRACQSQWPTASCPAAPDLIHLLLVPKLTITCMCVCLHSLDLFSPSPTTGSILQATCLHYM